MADFVCTEMEAFHRNAQPQKELLRSTGVWGVHQQVSSGKMDSQKNCLLEHLVPASPACYNCVGSRKLTASELCRCPNLSYNEDVLRERCLACYNCVGSRKLTASELCRCPNLSYNEDVLRERCLA